MTEGLVLGELVGFIEILLEENLIDQTPGVYTDELALLLERAHKELDK